MLQREQLDYSDRRVEPRTRAMIRARLRDGGAERDVCVLDVSTRGVLATTAQPPRRGEYVELMIGRHTLVGQVKWSGDHRFGLSLQQRMSVTALLAGDTDSIALEKSRSARTCRGGFATALRSHSDSFGHMLQFAVLVAAGLGGAVLLADLAEDGLESLHVAKHAMDHRRRDPS